MMSEAELDAAFALLRSVEGPEPNAFQRQEGIVMDSGGSRNWTREKH